MHHPEKSLKCFHVAGTKGKGSTCYLIGAILAQHGYRVGLYTSPHLMMVNERIRLLDKKRERLINSRTLDRLTRAVLKEAERLGRRYPRYEPTYFEVITVAALAYFAKEGVDFAVLETGLGGRWDATNAVNPLVTVITPISLDHTALLGRTVGAIANEKTGILKPGRPCVIMNRNPKVVKVVRREADRQRVFVVDAAARTRYTHVALGPKGSKFHFTTAHGNYGPIQLALAGEFQLENFSAAIQALEVWEGYGFSLNAKAVSVAAAKARWTGRLQVLQERPWLVVDGAHNEASVIALRDSIIRIFPYRRLFLVFAAARDKEIAAMGRVLGPLATEIWLTTFHSPRASSPDEIKRLWKPYLRKNNVSVSSSVEEALTIIKGRAHEGDLVCVTGSLYAVADALKARLKFLKKKERTS